MRPRTPARRGTVAIIVAVSLVALISFVAVAVDGGLLLHRQREVQSAADVAALSAAENLYLNYRIDQGKDSSGDAALIGKHVAADNGFDSTNSTVVVNIPPKSGLFKD